MHAHRHAHIHTYSPIHIHAPGHVTSPLSKVNWMNKEMDGADKENTKKNHQMEESGGLIQWADGSWCQFELFWSTELKPELQPSPKQVNFDPHDRHDTDTLYSFSSFACFVLTKTTFPSTALYLKLCTLCQMISIRLHTTDCNKQHAHCWR